MVVAARSLIRAAAAYAVYFMAVSAFPHPVLRIRRCTGDELRLDGRMATSATLKKGLL